MKQECQKSAGMLFRGEIEGLCDDDFEGSTTELHTSRNVYFGNDGGRGSKRCLVTGAINFERDYSKDADVSLGSNSGKSAITSQQDSRGKSGPVNLSDGFYKAPRNEPGGSVKRMKLSVDEKQNSLKNSHTVTCRLVESSNQGFSCSCYLLKKHIEMIQTGDKDNASSRLFRLDGSEQKEIGPSKAIASPVSQESSATKLPRWKDSCVVELDEADMSLSRESSNDPRPLLRYHINRLLKAAGWVIGRRKRSSHYNGVGEYVYMSPDGRSIRVFRRAWIMCGQNLFTDSNNALWGSEDLIQWDDLTQFMFDLSNTSTEIEKLNNLESSAALARYWYLLDPFANVVFIDKSFSSLRAGKVVNAKRSILKGDDDESLENAENAGRHLADSHLTAMPSGSSLVSNSVLTVSNGDSFDSKKYTHATYDNKHPDGLKFENSTDEGGLPLNCESLGPDIKSEKPRTQGNGQKKSSKCQLHDDDLLISAIIKTKNFKSTTKQSSAKTTSHKSKPLRKHQKSEKGSCRLLPRSSNKGGTHIVEGKWSTLGSRTVLSWLISSGVVSLSEVIQYRNTKDDTVVKDGLVTWDGILCRCCDTVLSVSAFKSHAGFRLAHPCMNLFMESGKPFTLCQLEAWSAEYKARKSATRTVEVDEMDQNDDSCGLCGGGGELICCDNCPSTFHQGCLYAKELPEGDWYCSHCTCQICGDVVNDNEASKSPGALKCSQCEHKYHETCLKKEKGVKADVASDIWFCGESCQDVYSGLHSRVGLTNLIADGFSWTLLRCIHGDQKVHSVQRLVALKAECNIKLAVALTIMEECFLPMVDARTGIDMIPHVLYNWGSQFARLNYHGFYTIVLEKNDVLLSVASIRIHGTTVAEMPLIATCSNYRRQGMCRYLMNAIEEILTTLKVEKLVISAIPSLVETWTMGFGFEPLEENERQSLNTINLMVFPGTVWLKKSFAYNEVATEQRMGSFHVSPSGTDDLGEAEAFPEGVHMIEPEGNVCTLELDGGTEIKRTYDMEIQVEEDEYEEDLDKQFSKLSEEEIASLRGDQLEEICPVETVEVYSDRKIPLTEQLEKSNVMQTNDK